VQFDERFNMIYEWDEDKRAANRSRHGIDFTTAEDFAWDTTGETKERVGRPESMKFLLTM